jgi:hypothetical protein
LAWRRHAGTGQEAEKRVAFVDATHLLNHRRNIFMTHPVAKLAQLRLQQRLNASGKTTLHMGHS